MSKTFTSRLKKHLKKNGLMIIPDYGSIKTMSFDATSNLGKWLKSNTSGNVASALRQTEIYDGTVTIEINPDETATSVAFDYVNQGQRVNEKFTLV